MTNPDDNKAEAAEAIRNIIRATVSAAGEPDPATLPHLVRQRLGDHALGEKEVNEYVREVMEEMRKA